MAWFRLLLAFDRSINSLKRVSANRARTLSLPIFYALSRLIICAYPSCLAVEFDAHMNGKTPKKTVTGRKRAASTTGAARTTRNKTRKDSGST